MATPWIKTKKRRKDCGGDQFSWDIQRWLGTKKGGGYWYQPCRGCHHGPQWLALWRILTILSLRTVTSRQPQTPHSFHGGRPQNVLAWTSATWCLEDTSSFHHWGNQKPSLLQTPRRRRCCCPSPHPKELLLQSPQNLGCQPPPPQPCTFPRAQSHGYSAIPAL